MKKVVLGIIVFFVLFLASVGIQFAINMQIKPIPMRPLESFNAGGSDRLIYYFDKHLKNEDLPEGIELTDDFINEELEGTFRYINGRYDVADFRVNSLVRLYLGFKDHLHPDTQEDIKTVLLNFKYWMDQGGEDSMCYWSENHQILFAVEEYLVGQAFPDDIFTVDGKTGLEHMEMAKNRINIWMEQRFLYGFTEWYSNNYYPEDISPMSNFIQYANDPVMVNRMKMIMDLLWFDMASQSFKYEGIDSTSEQPRTYYIFNSSMGRAYSDNRVSDDTGNRMRNYIDFVMQPEETKGFENSWFTSSNGFFNCFKQMMEALDEHDEPYYRVPDVIKEIFNDSSEEKVIKSSQSLNVEELEGEGLLGLEDHQIMMQWNMEAFSNPEVVDNTIKYMSKHNMFRNEFLNDFKMVNLWPLRAFNLLHMVSNQLNPSTNGVAIERANVYTYKTPHYSMHTAQAYQPGEYADQHAVSSINLSNTVSVFSTQPAKIPRRSGTPTYWTGNGRQPYSVQEKNVNISIYQPPTKVGFMEPMILKETTHVFFPYQLFDEVDETYLNQGYIFGRVGTSMIGIKARHTLEFVPFSVSSNPDDMDDMLKRGSVGNVLTEKYDLVQKGSGDHYFVTELSTTDDESFSAFMSRMMSQTLTYDQTTHTLSYSTILNNESTLTELIAIFDTSFSVNGHIRNLEYQRYESNYVNDGIINRKPDEIEFLFNGKSLFLDYSNHIRTVGD
ncbi:hypothetical protein [Peloplasma aerotolerans]|uniref:Uncharacterized protein n=1 Tax=Peloplasma aerotolerans TaxID=3044389 RepID=A0AAW6U9C4_9MOLU|nr:hypothetical protein [Mariniplasma sp. M4Ah]MDI6452666.1 hypothetical protein [Mariniplasma sp. M4Ah]